MYYGGISAMQEEKEGAEVLIILSYAKSKTPAICTL